MEKNKNIGLVAYVLISLTCAVVVGTVLMMLVYLLPASAVRKNMNTSIYIYEQEGDYYNWAPWREGSMLDNFTDSLMLNIAAFPGTGSAVIDAMKNYWVFYPELEAQVGGRRVPHLLRTLKSDAYDSGTFKEYPRYWHGYLIWLKPLLCITDFANIRILNMYIQLALLILIMIELYKISGYKTVIPFFFSMLIINPVSTVLCMQYACMYHITLISVLILLKRKLYVSRNQWKLFLWIGIATAFFDLLTYPIVALCTSLLLLVVLNEEPIPMQIQKIFLNTFVWLIVYAGMWGGKWIVFYLITGELAGVLKGVIYRLMGDPTQEAPNIKMNFFHVLKLNFNQVWKEPMLWIYLICLLLPIMLLITRRYRLIRFQSMIPTLMIGCYPFAWYFFVRNHSAIHVFFTHKNLAVTVLAVGLCIANSLTVNTDPKSVVRNSYRMKNK